MIDVMHTIHVDRTDRRDRRDDVIAVFDVIDVIDVIDVTGACVMAVEEGLDTGGVYATAVVPIGADATANDLRRELVEVGTRLLIDTLDVIDVM